MYKFIFSFALIIAAPALHAQKIEGEIGVLGAVNVKTEYFMYGGSLGLKARLKGGESVGIGSSAFLMNSARNLLLPVYGDLRIPVVSNVELTLQPGYTIYESSLAIPGTLKSRTKGSFYAGGGLTAYSPLKGGKRFFFQMKYNYFTFDCKVTTYLPNYQSVTREVKLKDHILSMGLGLAFR